MEVYGADDKELFDLQSSALALMTPTAAGRDRAAVLLAGQDPCWRAAVGPMVRWAQETWASLLAGPTRTRHLDLGCLSALHGSLLASPPRLWSQVRGPLGACLLSARRLGWTWPDPFRFISDEGAEFKLTEISPKSLQVEAQKSYFRMLEKRLAKRAGLSDNGRATVLPLTKLLRSKTGRGLTPGQVEAAKAIVADAVWTADKLFLAGYQVARQCVHCGQRDTWRHRVLDCPVASDLRTELLDEKLLQFLNKHPAHLRGILLAPSSSAKPPLDEGGLHYWSALGLPREQAFSGKVFVDGSCSKEADPNLNRAGWAITKLSENGDLEAVLSGPVWFGLPQTSPAAEFIALAALGQVAAPTAEVFSDFVGAVRAYNEGPPAMNGKRPYAGIVRSARTSAGWGHLASISKVMAHQSLDLFEKGSAEWVLAKGNSEADKWAKDAVLRHPAQEEVVMRSLGDIEVATGYLVYASQLLALWPAKVKLQRLPKAQRRERRLKSTPVADRHGGHTWLFGSGLWRCQSCCQFAFEHTQLQGRRGRCPGHSESMAAVLTSRQGHQLHVFEADGFFVLACGRCGKWAGRKPDELRFICLGVPTTAGRRAWSRLCSGKHPRYEYRVGPRIYLEPEVLDSIT